MQKRAFGDQAMIYVLVAVILGAIALVGWKMVFSTTSRYCNAGLVDFQVKLEEISALRNGITEEESFNVPCDANKVVIFDSDAPLNPDLIKNFPLLRDLVVSKSSKNVFLIRGQTIIESWTMPFVNIDDPYLLCAAPQSGKVDFHIEIARGETNITLQNPKQDCSLEMG